MTLRTARNAPLCTEIVLRDLATGDTMTTPQQCHGASVAGQLGPQVLTPTAPLLANNCEGPLYTCATDEWGQTWDRSRCMPWPAEGTTGDAPTTGDGTTGVASESTSDTGSAPEQSGIVEHGCACASGPASAREGLLALIVLGLRRRRQRVAASPRA